MGSATPSSDERRIPSPVVLFDLDDTLMAHREAVRRGILLHMGDRAYPGDDHPAAQRLWHELEEAHYHSYLEGRLSYEGQRRARARDFARAHGEDLDEESAGTWFTRYFERYRESWALHDDALDALDAVEAAVPRVRLGVITNGEADFQRSKLELLGILERFDHVVASGEVGVVKPDAEIFHVALARFAADAPVSAAVYVGDRLATDAIGAARAGLIGVWLNRHGAEASADEAEQAAASGVLEITTLTELAPLLARHVPG